MKDRSCCSFRLAAATEKKQGAEEAQETAGGLGDLCELEAVHSPDLSMDSGVSIRCELQDDGICAVGGEGGVVD